MSSEFPYRYVPAFDKKIHRLGLAAGYGIDAAGIRDALDGPISYVFWNPAELQGNVRALEAGPL